MRWRAKARIDADDVAAKEAARTVVEKHVVAAASVDAGEPAVVELATKLDAVFAQAADPRADDAAAAAKAATAAGDAGNSVLLLAEVAIEGSNALERAAATRMASLGIRLCLPVRVDVALM